QSDKQFIKLFITFNSGFTFSSVEDNWRGETSLAWRIIYYYFFDQIAPPFNMFMDLLQKQYGDGILSKLELHHSIQIVTEAHRNRYKLSANDKIFIYLGIDEVNKLLPDTDLIGSILISNKLKRLA